MLIELELWHLILLLIAFFGACAAAGKLLLAQTQTHIDQRFNQVSVSMTNLEKTNREEAHQWKQIERDLMALKADLPLNYVRREDYIRGQSVIESKLDGLATKIENSQLRGLIKGARDAD